MLEIAISSVNWLARIYVLRQNGKAMKILAVSDQAIERLYTLSASGHFQDVELILGCGDMPFEYLEYLVTMLNVPLFYVPGNHDPQHNPRQESVRPEGGVNLDLKTVRHKKFLIGGFGGSIRYRPDGVNQYSQQEAYYRAFSMLPRLLAYRIQYGRPLDIQRAAILDAVCQQAGEHAEGSIVGLLLAVLVDAIRAVSNASAEAADQEFFVAHRFQVKIDAAFRSHRFLSWVVLRVVIPRYVKKGNI